VRVPLDYDRPQGKTIKVSVIRLPAAAPQRRLGALFLNPGGPGGSGVDIARGLGAFLPLELRERFDIVGIDPRGISRSTPLRCYRTFDEASQDVPPFEYPHTRRQENRQIEADRALAGACRQNAGPVLRHMSTADVARDMDAVRAAMGDPQLNFLGLSYGSQLGQTFANMFPARVRSMVIDGVIDPRAWAGTVAGGDRVPVGTRLASAQGAQRTLHAFFRRCDAAGRDCAFSGNSRQRFARLVRAAENGDIPRVRVNGLISITLGALYASWVWPDLATFLRAIERGAPQAPVERTRTALRSALGLAAAQQEEYLNVIEGFPGVTCSDGDNPDGYRAYRNAADRAEQEYGYFGRLWNWAGSVCAEWPKLAGRDRYTGPWTAATPHPVLVVGNYFDPATRYKGAVTASRLLPNSRLLSYAGWGHTAFFAGNYCIDAAVTRYLVTTRPPAEGSVCQPAGSPFGPAAARAATPGAKLAIAALLPAAVRQAMMPR
jgi:pimeloyl-ACP methyl ester carboxylesterase